MFKGDNEQMMTCVQEFDKRLCLKANKQKVEQVEKWVDANYLTIKQNRTYREEQEKIHREHNIMADKIKGQVREF